jgi:hypothetical protein
LGLHPVLFLEQFAPPDGWDRRKLPFKLLLLAARRPISSAEPSIHGVGNLEAVRIRCCFLVIEVAHLSVPLACRMRHELRRSAARAWRFDLCRLCLGPNGLLVDATVLPAGLPMHSAV